MQEEVAEIQFLTVKWTKHNKLFNSNLKLLFLLHYKKQNESQVLH